MPVHQDLTEDDLRSIMRTCIPSLLADNGKMILQKVTKNPKWTVGKLTFVDQGTEFYLNKDETVAAVLNFGHNGTSVGYFSSPEHKRFGDSRHQVTRPVCSSLVRTSSRRTFLDSFSVTVIGSLSRNSTNFGTA